MQRKDKSKKKKRKKKKKKIKLFYNLNDMLFPKGKVAKLCRTRTPDLAKFNLKEILIKFKMIPPTPVIVLSGARFHDKGKFLAGIARAAFKCGASIIDSGVRTGIEPFCMRNSKIVELFH